MAIGEEREQLRESWEDHTARKKEAIVEKAVVKYRAKTDGSYHAVTFDLHAVLTTPFARDARIYYKRKLPIYTFTI